MRYRQIVVVEHLSHPRPYTWIEQEAGAHVATFHIGDIGYWVKLYLTRGRLPPTGDLRSMWVFNFGVDPATSSRLHGHPHAIMKPTRSPQPHTVIATVFAAIDDFVTHVHPDAIWFSDSDAIRSRARLYQRFAQHLIDHHGYQFDRDVMQHFAGRPVWFLVRA